ncbi:UNVERIFIED_CONTAM: hypothetical protein RMT77_010154 [Armadillidium vulgare]
MNKPKGASKSSDEIINEIFDSLNLPVTEELSKKSKQISSTIKGSLDVSRNSCNDLSDSDSSSSSDQEIDKLLEEITEVTDKDIKIVEADFTVAQKDKKKKKKKVKKTDTKIKHKKRKKKKSSKLRNSSDSESDTDKSKKNKFQKSFSSESIKDRSNSPDLNKTSHTKKSKLKSVFSRSRSKSLSKNRSWSRSRSRSKSRSRSRYSVSRSKGRSYYNNNTSKSRYNRSRSSSYSDLDYNRKNSKSKSRKRDPSRSPTYSPPKSHRRETKSRSPVKKEDKEPLDSWKSTKLASLKKSNPPPTINSTANKLKEIKSKFEETFKSTLNSVPNSDIKISESDKTSLSDKMTKESDSKSSATNNTDANVKTPDLLAKGQEKSKDEGKGKMIVIKNLKESSVLQQAEVAQQNKPKVSENRIENNTQQNNDVKKEDNIEKTSKDGKEKPEPENLLTAFKKSKKEKEEADKEKKDVKKSSKSRSRSRSISRKRSRSRSRGAVTKPQGKRKRSRSTSRSRKRRSRSRDRYKKRSRSRSRSKRSASRDRYRGGRRSRSGSRSKELSKSRGGKSASSKDKRKSPDCVDSLRDKATRKRLLEIARKNAVYLMKNNCLPPSIEKESVLRATGKSIEELTSFCKQLVSKGDYSENELSDPSLSPDERESFSSRHHHPFAVKDSKPIMMNIRNAPMLPTKTNAERLADASKLREQFPVSSGTHHRTVESEWVPVEKDESKDGDSAKVFPDDTARDIDISQLVSTRLNAMRRLQDNPTDKEAMKILSSAQKDMQNWALSKQVPGQFTGSTGARILSAEELSSGYQAWAKKGQFINASPVTSHFGMKILQKMGWNPGEGLGKDKKGSLIPLLIDVKMDKRGLTAANEVTPRRQAIPLAKTLQGKHPVSALVELCSKRKWGPPEFEIVFDSGPDHKKNFLIQVHVNNQTFKTSCAASTKKIAKANAAAACLQALGLIPEDGAAPVKSQETLNTTSQLPTTDPSSTSPSTEQPTGDGAQTTEAPSKEGSQDSSQGNYTAAVAATDDAVPQYSTDNSHTTTAPYVSDGTMTQYRNDSSQDGTMSQYRADTSQAANQYDSSAMSQYQSQYSSDGTQSMAQYADSQTMGGYSAEAMAQYSTNGTQDMSQYQANSTEAMAQYSSTDPQAMAQYAQSAVAGYSTDGSQTSIAQYSQAYQQYSAEAIQAYQQQYSSSGGSQNQSGAFTFPQPPRSLTHGITSENGGSAEAGSANQGNRGDSSTSTDSQSHSGSGSQSDPYRNSYGTGYSSSSSYNQMQYYDGSYQQGSQY